MFNTIARTVVLVGCALDLLNKKFCVFIVLMSFTTFVIGQSEESDLRSQNAINTQTVLPTSPESSSLGQYGNVPVSAYTGTANVSIPIHTITGHRIGLTINANYATGGIKVEDRGSGSLGIGWALNAGGSISRAVKGAPDMHYNYYDHAHIFDDYYLETSENFDLYDFYYDVVHGNYETQPDAYHYSFNGRTGKFYIGANKNVIQKEDSDLRIELVFAQATASLQVLARIRITDETGTVYTFQDSERTFLQYDDSAAGLTGAAHYNHEYNSSWHLSRIESYDGTERILFNYDVSAQAHQIPINIENYKSRNFTINVTADPTCTSLENTTGKTVTADIDQLVILNRHYLSDIKYVVGTDVERLQFYLSPTTCNYATNLDKQLDSIRIYKGVRAATHHLTQYFDYDCLDDRLFLLQTGISSASAPHTVFIPPYQFSYDAQSLPSPLSKSQDKWGFYNGKMNTSLIPHSDIPGITWTGANRTSVPSKAKARSLIRVTYPTGGYTTYNYEGNSIPNPELIFEISDCSPSPCASYESCQEDFSDCDGDLCVQPTQNTYSVSFNSSIVNNGYFEIYSEYLCGDGPQPFTNPPNESQSISKNVSWTGTATLLLFRTSDNFQVGAYSKSFTTSTFSEVIKIADHFNIVPWTNYRLEIQGTNTRTTASTKIGDFSSTIMDKQIGGIRLAKVLHFDRNGEFLKGKAYRYTDEYGSVSSGIVVSEPQFQEEGSYSYQAPNSIPPCSSCCFYDYTTLRLTAGPSFPMGSFDGSFYGYSRVEEIDLLDASGFSTEGKTVFHFHNHKKTGDIVDVVRNGKLKEKELFNASGQLVKKEVFEYAFDIGETQREHVFYGFQISSKPSQDNRIFLYSTSMGEYFWTNNAATQANEVERRVYHSKWERNTSDYMKLVNYSTFLTGLNVFHFYYNENGILNGQVAETIKNDYSSNLNVAQATKTTTTNSNGDIHQIRYHYPDTYTLSADIKNRLLDANLILPAWQSQHVYNDHQIDGKQTNWGFYTPITGLFTSSNTGIIYPHQVYRYERTWDQPTQGSATGNLESGSWDLQLTASDYDRLTGRPEKTRRSHWAFDDEYRYDSAGNLLTYSYDQYEQQWHYHPSHYLLKTVIAIDSTSQSYEWDELLRLKSVKDNDRNVITEIVYNYGNISNSISTATTYPKLGTQARTLTNIEYFDDLGRYYQTRKKSQGPTLSQSIILGKSYDKIGRIQFEYEPRAIIDADSSVVLSGDKTTFIYEKSPLERRLEIISAEDWMRTNYQYGTNDTGEVNGYNKGTLYKKVTINGNDSLSIVFTDKRGNVILSRRFNDGLAHDTYSFYDGKDRQTVVVPPGTSLTDSDLTFRWKYDNSDHVESAYIPGKGLTEYRYNLRGLPMYVRDPKQYANNRWRALTYDQYGNIDKEGWYNYDGDLDNGLDSNAILDEIKIDLDFGTSGVSTGKQLKSKVHQINSHLVYTNHYRYDDAGRLSSTEFNHIISPVDSSLKTNFTYDSADNIIQKHCDYTNIASSPFEFNVSKEYDHAGRLKHEWYGQGKNAQHKLSTYSYTAKNETERLTVGNSVQTVDFSYKKNGLLQTINGDSLSGNDRFQQKLFYNMPKNTASGMTGRKNGDITSWEWQIDGESSFYYNNAYDGLNRLIASEGFGSIEGAYSAEYDYDERGNLTFLARTNKDGQYIDALNYTYGIGNRLTAIQDSSGALANEGFVGSDMASQYSYDENGNIIFDENRGMLSDYNHLNLPNRFIETTSHYTDYIYDELGNLLHKRSRENGGPQIDIDYVGDVEYEQGQVKRIHHQYGYIELDFFPDTLISLAGIQMIDTDECYQSIFSHETITDSIVVNYFAEDCLELLPGFYAQLGSQFLADYKAAGKERFYWTLKDHLGNTRVVLDNEAKIIQKNNYYPFGMRWQYEISPDFEYTYNGKEEQSGLPKGILNYGARFYDPQIGRFSSVDNYAQKYSSLTPYQYGGNNPLKFIDVNGDSLVAVVLPGLNSQHPTRRQQHFFVDESIAVDLVGFVTKATSKFPNLSVNNIFRSIPSSQIKTNHASAKFLSRHQAGFAIDLNGVTALNSSQLADLNRFAAEFGFNPLKNQQRDLPHFDVDPTVSGFSSLSSAVDENTDHFNQIVNSMNTGGISTSALTDPNGNIIGVRFVKANQSVQAQQNFNTLVRQLIEFSQ